MTVAKKPFKIIIVGGSIAGLALANMLERVGIDFVVLEAWSDIAPQVGASIAIYPHMARILDQIGCWHGYPVIFIERQMLIRRLYEHLQQKDKVLLQKRCVQVEHTKEAVRVITQDGNSYEGDIVVGADGMHSTVRKQMHSIANSLSPGHFDSDEYSKVPCTYRCIFGISHQTKGIEQGTNHIVMGKNYSYLILTGPGRVYWFLNAKDPRVTYGKEVPRYSREDELHLAEQHFGDRLNEYDTFGDVYKKKIISRLTPLHEYQWKRWHFKRIITIGDASHKLHPISGNGGAAAVEDSAALVNALLYELGHSNQPLSTEQINDVFAKAQRVQENRTRHLVDHATKMQQFDAMESVLAPLMVKFVIPNLTDDDTLAIVGGNVVQAQRIESLPVPKRDRYVPYDDELPAKPLKNAFIIAKVGFILLYSLLFYQAYSPAGASEFLTKTLGTALPGRYIDALIHHNALAGETSSDEQLYSLSSVLFFVPMILIWTIEGHRRGNIGSLGSWRITLLFVTSLLFATPAKILPLYFLLATLNSSRPAYASTAGRPVPVPVVKATIAATCTIYALSALTFLIPTLHQTVSRHATTPPYSLLPIALSALTQHLTTRSSTTKLSLQTEPPSPKAYLTVYQNKDYPPLILFYRVLFALCLLTHIFAPAFSIHHYNLLTAAIVAHCLQSALELRALGYATTRQVLAAAGGIPLATTVVGPAAVYVGVWQWREGVVCGLSR